ncbi:hypothetical protein Ga0074812_10946 [Parafrankia irregularis]|uniref:Methylisocitrate lyase n=1 Tax=Parafrankia irregularis TaxID=795642 RepID=A0A0S4QQP2_9ACTN|nr:hypothetical protein Ga0074812_10946 [Parafrankia irregularis]
MVIYPVTLLRLAMGAVEDGLRTILADGTQAGVVDRMQTRARLYKLPDHARLTPTGSSASDARGAARAGRPAGPPSPRSLRVPA